MSAARRAVIVGAILASANAAGIGLAVLNGADLFVAFLVAALVMLAVAIASDVATLTTGRSILWGGSEPRSHQSTLSSLLGACAMVFLSASTLVLRDGPNVVLGVLIPVVVFPLLGVSTVLSFRELRANNGAAPQS
jgi:hypothetical protein